MTVTRPAVVIAHPDGTVLSQNRTALDLLGRGQGRTCWDFVGSLEGARGLPCTPGCVGRLVQAGVDHASRTPFTHFDQPFELSCVPVEHERVVCTLSPAGCAIAEAWERLSPRELEVLELVAEGLDGPAIARALGIREGTVRAHVQHMRQKLGVPSRAALVARGFRLGLLR